MSPVDFALLELLDTPLFWMNEQGIILWHNAAAQTLLDLRDDERLWNDLCRQLPDGYIYRLHVCALEGAAGTLVECMPDANPELTVELRRLQAANDELERIFNASFDEVFVTDGNGVTLRVNEATERLYGLSQKELVGKTVYELERQRVFYPSVTAMALREKKRLTILQTTLDGRRLLTTANPVFDQEGQIIQVISNAKDMSDVPLTGGQIADFSGISAASPASPGSAGRAAIAASSPAMQTVLALVHKVAQTDALILLLGETGAGKDLMAEFIHQCSRGGRRARGPQGAFVRVDCAAIPDTLLESELFGYERGAFTGAKKEGKHGHIELAEGGTLFLDEIGEIPLHLQGKLLHVLQQRTFIRIGGTRRISVNARIIAASNRDLAQMVEAGTFRADLYYRLNVVPIRIPPLRERKEDIVALARTLLSKFADRHHLTRKTLHQDALDCLLAYAWPGNVRELENLMERLAITVDEEIITREHLPDAMRKPWPRACAADEKRVAGGAAYATDEKCVVARAADEGRVAAGADDDILTPEPLAAQMAKFEKEVFARAARRFPSTYAIAKELEISQPTVVRKLKRYGLR